MSSKRHLTSNTKYNMKPSNSNFIKRKKSIDDTKLRRQQLIEKMRNKINRT